MIALYLVVALLAQGQQPQGTRTVTGVVVNRDSMPVASARVFHSAMALEPNGATTDAQGRFTIEQAPVGTALLFVRKNGYRFGGAIVGPDAKEVSVTVALRDEPPVVQLETLPPPIPRDEELLLAQRVLEPCLQEALESKDEGARVRPLEVLALVNPARLLELMDSGQATAGMKNQENLRFFDSMYRLRVAETLRHDDPDEAEAVVQNSPILGSRAQGRLEVYDVLPESDRRGAKGERLLDRALADARAETTPWDRLCMLSQVIDRRLDRGERDKADPILKEGRALAEQMPPEAHDGYARGCFAEELACVDLDAALALCKDLERKFEYDRHHGNIAHELAGRDPAAAGRVLGMLTQDRLREQYAVKVVYRMARVDMERARKIAAAIGDPVERGYAQGMMALALANTDVKRAADLLEEALTCLETHGHDLPPGPGRSSLVGPAPTAAALLPVVERVAPDRLAETTWRVVAMRSPPHGEDLSFEDQDDMRTALLMARYDRELAQALAEPGIASLVAGNFHDATPGQSAAALAAIDPRRAVAVVEAMKAVSASPYSVPKSSSQMAVAKLLARPGERRWRHVVARYLYLWVADTEDIDTEGM